MSISHKVPRSSEPATVLQFPTTRLSDARHHATRAEGESIVTETYWMIVALSADGSMHRTKMRAPRFLSPCRAYSWSGDADSGVRSLLLYKFARRPARSASGTARERLSA